MAKEGRPATPDALLQAVYVAVRSRMDADWCLAPEAIKQLAGVPLDSGDGARSFSERQLRRLFAQARRHPQQLHWEWHAVERRPG